MESHHGTGTLTIQRVLWLGFVSCFFLSPVAKGGSPKIWRADHIVETDTRVAKDRLQAKNNPNGEDDSFLNAVGAVWPYGMNRSAASYAAATGQDAASGFLIDPCHVLTNMHTVYTDDDVAGPPIGHPVMFAVGQTDSAKNSGALQGLRFLFAGTVVAHGDTLILGHWVRNPENDWAVIRLTVDVDSSIAPMTIAAIDLAQLPRQFKLSAAGFPTDHRTRRGDGFKLKDLWESEGRIVEVVPLGTGAVIQTTIQTTPGSSGGPVYGQFNGRKHLVVGIVQGFRGNGIDVAENGPNLQVLLTPGTLAAIAQAQRASPCH